MGGRDIPAGYHAAVSRLDVYERDGWICGICGAPVKREWNDARKERLAPVLDHIVPVSKFGPHDMSNVCCAHRICNRAKLDRDMDETQRALKLVVWLTGCESIPEVVGRDYLAR